MKRIFAVFCVSVFPVLALLPQARAQVWEFGARREIVRIGASARQVLKDYLKAEYKRLCPPRSRNLSAVCGRTRPLYVGSSLPRQEARALPPEVLKKLGFVEPGTDYRQLGFAVYLVSLQRLIIADEVSLVDTE